VVKRLLGKELTVSPILTLGSIVQYLEGQPKTEQKTSNSPEMGFLHLINAKSVPKNPATAPQRIYLPGQMTRACLAEISQTSKAQAEFDFDIDFDAKTQQYTFSPTRTIDKEENTQIPSKDVQVNPLQRLFKPVAHVASFHTHTPDLQVSRLTSPSPSHGIPSDIYAFVFSPKYAYLHLIGSSNGLCALVSTQEVFNPFRLIEPNAYKRHRVVENLFTFDYPQTNAYTRDGSIVLDIAQKSRALAYFGYACYWVFPDKTDGFVSNPPSDNLLMERNITRVQIGQEYINTQRNF
jgi:hypothetical protein